MPPYLAAIPLIVGSLIVLLTFIGFGVFVAVALLGVDISPLKEKINIELKKAFGNEKKS